MAPIYKIALIQFIPKECAPEDNFTTSAGYIRQAASQGAHLAVLPEYHLTSWCPENPEWLPASKASASYLPRYQALAREANISIVPGTIVEVDASAAPSSDDEAGAAAATPVLLNVAYFVAAGTGALAGRYVKKNLWHPERPHLQSSGHTPHAVFDAPGPDGGAPVPTGLLVCWDLAFPEAFRALVARGARLVVVPSFWRLDDVDGEARRLNPRGEQLFLDAAVVCRACENAAAVVFVNAAGRSQVALPHVGVVGGRPMPAGEEAVRVLHVDLGVLEVAERNYGVRRDMAREGWHYAHTLKGDGGE